MARNESEASREVYACWLSYDKLCEQLVNLKLGNMLREKYMQKFDELKTWSQVVEDPTNTSSVQNWYEGW